jgi:flagellar hook-associated protein 2
MTEIKTDILSAVSRSGSGLEIKSLVTGLVAAETSAERSLNERRIEEANTTISAMGQLSQEIGLFNTGMSRAAEAASRTATSSTPAVSIEVIQESIATDVSAVVEVKSLASDQILTSNFLSSDPKKVATNTTPVSTGTLTLNTLAWDNPISLEINSTNNTLNGLVRAINGVDGLSASLINTGNGVQMIIKSQNGTENALDAASITNIENKIAGIAGENSENRKLTEKAATNAEFTIDGLTVTRGTNVIDDVFPGQRITLNAVDTPTVLRSSETTESVRDRVTDFLNEINALKSYLTTATQRGLNGAKPGPLAGDVAAQSILSRVSSITTQPIFGFGSEPVFLAQLGVQTERDGTLTINQERFESAIARRPELADALFSTQYSATDDNLTVRGLSFAPPKAGSYALSYDPASPSAATLNGNPLSVSTNSQGQTVLRSSSPDTNGVSIILERNELVNADIRYGQSLADKLREYGNSLLGSNGLLARREQTLGKDLLGFEDQLTAVDEKAALLTERYNIQFGRMEALITSLNKTGEYMKSLMDAWSSNK